MSDRDRLGPPPVEPMTNAAWTRVERGLFEQLDAPVRPLPAPRPRAWWPWLALPAVAAAAVIAIVITRGSSTTAPVIATPSQLHDEPSRVVAGDTPSEVSYGDAHLTVEAHAAIVMTREAGSPSILVERGAIDFSVAPREHAPFIVRAGDVVVRVVGTQFRVARSDERVTVVVERGIVDVQYRGELHRLTAGQSWSSSEPTASNAPAKTVPAPTKAVTAPVTDPPPAPKPAIAANGKPTPTTSNVPTPTTTTPTTKTEPVTAPVAPKPAITDEERAKHEYERLTGLERRAPDKAMAGYLELAKGNSSWSPNALYAAGRLALDRKDKRARTLLKAYVTRFPNGDNVAIARDLLTRLDGEQP